MKILKQIFLGMMLIASPVATANDQEVLIEQAGDNVIIEANQEGYDNVTVSYTHLTLPTTPYV